MKISDLETALSQKSFDFSWFCFHFSWFCLFVLTWFDLKQKCYSYA